MTYIIQTALRMENQLTEEVRQIRTKGHTAADCHCLWKVLNTPPRRGNWNYYAAVDNRVVLSSTYACAKCKCTGGWQACRKLSHVGSCIIKKMGPDCRPSGPSSPFSSSGCGLPLGMRGPSLDKVLPRGH